MRPYIFRWARAVPKPPSSVPYLVVGGGIAGGAALATLRRGVPASQSYLVGAEPVEPYDRPALSKEFLAHEPTTNASIRLAELRNVDMSESSLLGRRAVSLDSDARVVTLDDGATIEAEHALLVATGVAARPLPVPGSNLPGVFQLRSLADAEKLREALQEASSAIIVGAGLIGTELASECRRRGTSVVLIEAAPMPVSAISAGGVGEYLSSLYASHGVQLKCDAAVRSIAGHPGAMSVDLVSGERLTADLVIVGIGSVPCTGWLEDSGLVLGNGVVVNEYCESSAAGIYAAGDIASAWRPRLNAHLRVEHESNAHVHGAVAARNMLGRRTVHDALPFAWSRQFDQYIWSIGSTAVGVEEVASARHGGCTFAAYFDARERVLAIVGVCPDRSQHREQIVARSRLAVTAREEVSPRDFEAWASKTVSN
jgi:3-phenylpropionate/trans-cinnamate dioxygenase ferredoxin reductase subunit